MFKFIRVEYVKFFQSVPFGRHNNLESHLNSDKYYMLFDYANHTLHIRDNYRSRWVIVHAPDIEYWIPFQDDYEDYFGKNEVENICTYSKCTHSKNEEVVNEKLGIKDSTIKKRGRPKKNSETLIESPHTI